MSLERTGRTPSGFLEKVFCLGEFLGDFWENWASLGLETISETMMDCNKHGGWFLQGDRGAENSSGLAKGLILGFIPPGPRFWVVLEAG